MKRGTFLSNLAGNGSSMAVNMVVGVWFTAYLVRKLGPASYGLIPLATTMASYMSVLTLALTAAVGRSITVAHGAGNTAEVDRVFNTAYVGCLVFSAVLLPVALVVGYLTPHWLSVPAGQENEARILFIAAGLVFLLTTASTPYGVALFCRNRLDLSSLINAGMTLLRVGIVALLFSLTMPDLWQVAAGIFCAAVAGTLVSIFFSRRLMPELKFRPSAFSPETLKGLAST
ncbi:MAG: oligosaccharide flippase family protein, partial [Verrucomicrobiaceae bacterium]